MYLLFPRIWFDGVLQCKRFSWRKIWARSDPLCPARYHAHRPTNRVRESFISMLYAKVTLCTFTSFTLFVFRQYIVQGDTHLFFLMRDFFDSCVVEMCYLRVCLMNMPLWPHLSSGRPLVKKTGTCGRSMTNMASHRCVLMSPEWGWNIRAVYRTETEDPLQMFYFWNLFELIYNMKHHKGNVSWSGCNENVL